MNYRTRSKQLEIIEKSKKWTGTIQSFSLIYKRIIFKFAILLDIVLVIASQSK